MSGIIVVVSSFFSRSFSFDEEREEKTSDESEREEHVNGSERQDACSYGECATGRAVSGEYSMIVLRFLAPLSLSFDLLDFY